MNESLEQYAIEMNAMQVLVASFIASGGDRRTVAAFAQHVLDSQHFHTTRIGDVTLEMMVKSAERALGVVSTWMFRTNVAAVESEVDLTRN